MKSSSSYSSTDDLCPKIWFKHNSSHIISKRCEEGRPFLEDQQHKKDNLLLNKYNKAKHILIVLPHCMGLPQLTVQGSSWTFSSAGSTIWSWCYLTPARGLCITAAQATNKSLPQWSLHPTVMMTLAWTWTVVCSAPVRMQVTAWSWLWRCLNYAIISRKPRLITNHDKKLVE